MQNTKRSKDNSSKPASIRDSVSETTLKLVEDAEEPAKKKIKE
jgi:hypothetical protein